MPRTPYRDNGDWRDAKDVRIALTSNEAEERFRALVQHAPDIIALFDASGVLSYASPALTRILGYDPGELLGLASPETIHPDDFHEVVRGFEQAMTAPGEPAPLAFRARAADGSYRYLEATFTNLFEVPAVAAMVINARDVTERAEAAAALLHQALHDPLTDLPNRDLFLDRVSQCLRSARRRRSCIAVLYLDIDHFATVNRAFGREAADQVLVAIAGLLETGVRDGDSVARVGGDEFVVCCEDVVDAEQAVALAERLCEVISVPFGAIGRELQVTASVGIALAGSGTETADSLLRDADAAMYQAKRRGRNRSELFDTDMRARTAARAEVAAQLRRAIDDGEIVVHYQPVVSLAERRITGIEALARWRRRSGLAPPAEFIPAAEESGLIAPLGQRVLEIACRDTAAWNRRRPEAPLTVAVNLSAHQLVPGLPAAVQRALEEAGLDPSHLCLELTESALMDDADAVALALEDLKRLGVRLGVDDFGTGYSSLLYLRRFPIDSLKIDRSFVEGMARGEADAAIVEGVIGLAHALGLEAIAEGVETAAQEAGLRALGCELAQGYRWAEPMDAAALRRWLGTAREGARLAG